MVRRAPLWACLRDAFAFLPRAWVAAPGALALLAAALAAPAALAAAGYGSPLVFAALGLVGVPVGLTAQGALLRIGVSRDLASARAKGLGPLGLQFGRPEVRLLLAGLLVALFIGVIAIGLLVAGAILSGVAGLDVGVFADEKSLRRFVDHEPWKAAVLGAFALAVAATFVGLGVKLSLYEPATIGRERIVSLDALALADGAFWTLLLGWIVVLLPTVVLFWLNWRATGQFELAGRSALDGGTTDRAALVRAAVEAAVTALVQAPLTAGFLSAAYRRLEYSTGGPPSS